MELGLPLLASILQIIWIDILLSGDNAVVIALACRSLPPRQKRIGIILGAGAAIVLRILFALIISYLLEVPFLRLIGGVLLLWIAVKLITGEAEHESEVSESENLWGAVRTIVIADAVMSFDNVIAIAAASHGNPWLFIFGLALSVPLIVMGSTMIMALISRFPAFVWAGAALLGWVGGDVLVSDPFLTARIGAEYAASLKYPSAAIGAILVLIIGFALTRLKPKHHEA